MRYDLNRETTNDIAANWALKNNFDQLSENDQIVFEEWLAQSADHVKAYDQACLVMEDLHGLKDLPEAALISDTVEEGLPTSWAGKLRNWLDTNIRPVTAGAAIAAVLAIILIAPAIWQGPGENYRTALAEVREILLEDGSRVTLGGKSEIEVSFSDEARYVTLLKGRAFFSVEKDNSRPFLVSASKSVIKVVGTKFDVHLGKTRERISVLEGLVSVTSRQEISQDEKYNLVAGDLLTVTNSFVQKSKAVQEAGEWRTGRLIYEAAPLIEVIGDANRYYQGEIIIENTNLNDLPVTTSFSVKQIDNMVETLTHILPLKVEYKTDGRVLLHPKD